MDREDLSRAEGSSQWIDAFIRSAELVAIVAAYLAMSCLLGLTLLILAEISVAAASRFFPSLPSDIGFAWEYSAYLMGAAFMLGSGLTMRAGSHIRLGLVVGTTNPSLRRPLELMSSLIGLFFVGFLTWTLVRFTFQSFTNGQVSTSSLTPLWIPQLALTIGSAVLCLQLVARVLACLTGRAPDNETLKVASVGE